MTAAPAARPVPCDDARRRRALSHAIYSGQTIPSAEIRQGEFFVTIHHGLLRALVQARSLTASQLRYLMCVLEFSAAPRGYVVIRSAGGMRLPTIGDWCAWLGGMQPPTGVYPPSPARGLAPPLFRGGRSRQGGRQSPLGDLAPFRLSAPCGASWGGQTGRRPPTGNNVPAGKGSRCAGCHRRSRPSPGAGDTNDRRATSGCGVHTGCIQGRPDTAW
jgi:hypothetical protein